MAQVAQPSIKIRKARNEYACSVYTRMLVPQHNSGHTHNGHLMLARAKPRALHNTSKLHIGIWFQIHLLAAHFSPLSTGQPPCSDI